ncbi:MAG: hypothetical protein ACLQIQ_19375 [Beijerinckiaceae bacterium]
MKLTKAKPREYGSTSPVDLAIPVFGYQNHISIDRRFGFIRKWSTTDAAVYEGRRLRKGLLEETNTASSVPANMQRLRYLHQSPRSVSDIKPNHLLGDSGRKAVAAVTYPCHTQCLPTGPRDRKPRAT